MTLTRRQSDLWRFLATYMAKNNTAPSYVECMKGIGLSSRSQVNALMNGLQDRGKIRRIPGKPRAVEMLEWPEHGAVCPHCGAEVRR